MWGEIIEIVPEQNQVVDVSSVIEQARQKDCLSMYNIPSFMEGNREIKLSAMNSRMIYAGELHNLVSKMTNVMDDAELAVKYNLVMPNEMLPVSIPEEPVVSESIVTRKPIQYIDKEYNSFTMGFGKNPPILTETTRRKIEAKCIATLLTQIGLLETSSTILDVMVDVLETFFQNICKDLRSANDAVLSGEYCGFSDVVEQVLIKNGLGGIQGVCDYYEKRVKNYVHVLKERYKEISSRYDALLVPVNMQIEAKAERMEEMDSEDVPEVHFTAMDGEEGYLQPFLESGFQMLNTLEEGQL